MALSVSTLQKLLQKSSPPTRILTSLHNPALTSVCNHQSHLLEEASNAKAPPLLGSVKGENLRTTHLDPWLFYPITPIGLGSSPSLSYGLVPDSPVEEDSGMWADSVKKKRKKKMNKHKYRKLKKRLRRQT